MKIKVLFVLFLLSVLICGGGIDSDSVFQAILGATMTFLAGGAFVFEANKKEHGIGHSNNVHSYPSFLR